MTYSIFKAAVLMLPALAFGADYYVATDGDNTTGDGTIGNPYATVQKALNKADTPGDNILVRGGTYAEQANVYFGGDETGYITIKPYNGEKVVFDGSVTLTGWTQCASATEAGGNTNWQNIYYTDAPSGIPIFNTNVYEGDSAVQMGQKPFPTDPYFNREQADFRDVPQGSGDYTISTLTDPDFMTEAEDDYWTGAIAIFHASDNRIKVQSITDYNASMHTITYTALPSANAAKDAYCLANHKILIDRPGTYYYDFTNRKIYYWPLKTASLEDGSIRISKLGRAFYVSATPYIRIQDFTFKYYTNNVVYARAGADHFNLKNCTFMYGISSPSHEATIYETFSANCIIENNRLYRNRYNKGVVFQGGNNNTLQYNELDVNGSTAIDFYTEENSACLYNTVVHNTGVHANGLTFYEGCLDILVAGNYVYESNIALTMQASSRITIINNVLSNPGGNVIAMWGGGTPNNCTILNNTVFGALYLTSGLSGDIVVKNNIMSGYCPEDGVTLSHNIYYSPQWCQDPPGDLRTGEFVHTDVASLFMDYANADYILSSSSAAKDAGTDVSSYYPEAKFPDFDFTIDKRGAVRPTGAGWDIGAYEYTTSGMTNDTWQMTNAALHIPNPAKWSQVLTIPGVRVLNLDGSEAVYGMRGVFLMQSPEGISRVLIQE